MAACPPHPPLAGELVKEDLGKGEGLTGTEAICRASVSLLALPMGPHMVGGDRDTAPG